MPRGIPRSGKRKTQVTKVVDTTSSDAVVVEKTVPLVEKLTYSCGCPIVPVNEFKNKPKCIKHMCA